jgi:putative FmdB family regulatory protein
VLNWVVPIYEYELIDGGCSACGGRFELRRPISRPALTHCPLCKKAVRKLVSGVSSPSLTKPLSVTDAKKAGFSVYEKRDKGVYEKQ